jgi:hypothetical protein
LTHVPPAETTSGLRDRLEFRRSWCPSPRPPAAGTPEERPAPREASREPPGFLPAIPIEDFADQARLVRPEVHEALRHDTVKPNRHLVLLARLIARVNLPYRFYPVWSTKTALESTIGRLIKLTGPGTQGAPGPKLGRPEETTTQISQEHQAALGCRGPCPGSQQAGLLATS